MANDLLYTDVFQAMYITNPPVPQEGSVVGGRLRRIVAKITGAGETTPTIHFCRPPKGSRLSSLSKILFDAFGTSCTMSVGTGITGAGVAAAPACFKAATSIAAIGSFDLDLLAGADYVFDGDTNLTGTIAGAVLATGKIMVAEIVLAGA